MGTLCLLTLAASLSSCSPDRQVPDESFQPEIGTPAYSVGKGPVIMLDEAHASFHTVDGRYKPFVRLLERDGYVIRPATSKVSWELLSACTIRLLPDVPIANIEAKIPGATVDTAMDPVGATESATPR